MLPADALERAAREADWHLQMSIDGVEVLRSEARVSGRVLRVFRGPHVLLDSKLTVLVPIAEPGVSQPPSGVTRTRLDKLRVGSVIEGFFEGMATGVQAALGLVVTLDAATDLPRHYLAAPAPPPEVPRRRSWLRVVPLVILGALCLYVALQVIKPGAP